MLNALSIDVEECFQATEIGADPGEWLLLPSRVEAQTQVVIDLLDRHSVKATFFILGWVARHHPRVVRSILDAGHEIGCHSYFHRLVYDLSPAEFRRDTADAVHAIEDAGGVTPRLYRAPSYSITTRSLWALEILAEQEFTHDSSIYPIEHDRYGIPNFGRDARIEYTPSGAILEIPITTVDLFNWSLPIGGGAYLRLLPYRYTAAGIRRLHAHDRRPACIYFHPWELDSAQPRLANGWISKLRTYAGLKQMAVKLERLVTDLEFTMLTEVYPGLGWQPLLVENAALSENS